MIYGALCAQHTYRVLQILVHMKWQHIKPVCSINFLVVRFCVRRVYWIVFNTPRRFVAIPLWQYSFDHSAECVCVCVWNSSVGSVSFFRYNLVDVTRIWTHHIWNAHWFTTFVELYSLLCVSVFWLLLLLRLFIPSTLRFEPCWSWKFRTQNPHIVSITKWFGNHLLQFQWIEAEFE